jgi:glycosyltransferase involved in cell wall biosynthesis
MSFSESANSVGRLEFKKVFHLVYLIFNAIKIRFSDKIEILYYFPAGPNMNPIIRDFILLSFIRPFFKRTIFHFRAAGLSDFLKEKNTILRTFLRLPYNKPDIAIQLSSYNPPDGKYIGAKTTLIVPNGIEDRFDPKKRISKLEKSRLSILFVGALHRSKGIFNLIEAASIIIMEYDNVVFDVLGEFYDPGTEEEINRLINKNNMSKYINFHGVKLDQEKWKYFYEADIFCFPTYFESESFGNVILEAMMFELPIVSTHWRGIPELVVPGKNGLLAKPNNSVGLSEMLKKLIKEPQERLKMGLNGRNTYLERYTLDRHISRMNQILVSIV